MRHQEREDLLRYLVQRKISHLSAATAARDARAMAKASRELERALARFNRHLECAPLGYRLAKAASSYSAAG